MINFSISQTKTVSLYQKMTALNISEKDIVETFIHSSGKGGQNVNKVATCVRLKHGPTGIEIKCQKSRQQILNRYYARCLLVEKIDMLLNQKRSIANQEIEKIKRQKRKRSKRAKNKMLDNKKHQSQKKQGRKSITD